MTSTYHYGYAIIIAIICTSSDLLSFKKQKAVSLNLWHHISSAHVLKKSITSTACRHTLQTLHNYVSHHKQLLLPEFESIIMTEGISPRDNPAIAFICHRASRTVAASFFTKYMIDLEQDLGIGDTPLHHASWAGNYSCVEWLLQKGANPGRVIKRVDRDERSINTMSSIPGETPLHMAQNSLIAISLISHGARLHVTNETGEPPLMSILRYAAMRANARYEGESLLAMPPIQIPVKKEDIEQYRAYAISSVLLHAHAHPNVFELTSWKTPLHYAYEFGFNPVTHLLYEFGAQEKVDLYNRLPQSYKQKN